MAEVTIPKEKMNYTIDLLITMVMGEVAEELFQEGLTIDKISWSLK